MALENADWDIINTLELLKITHGEPGVLFVAKPSLERWEDNEPWGTPWVQNAPTGTGTLAVLAADDVEKVLSNCARLNSGFGFKDIYRRSCAIP
jgi:hypothetical protein